MGGGEGVEVGREALDLGVEATAVGGGHHHPGRQALQVGDGAVDPLPEVLVAVHQVVHGLVPPSKGLDHARVDGPPLGASEGVLQLLRGALGVEPGDGIRQPPAVVLGLHEAALQVIDPGPDPAGGTAAVDETSGGIDPRLPGMGGRRGGGLGGPTAEHAARVPVARR